MPVGEFGIDTAGEIRPRDKLLQAVGRDLATRPKLIKRVLAGLTPLESIDALEPQQLRRTTEL